jgi:hypothetical protein
MITNTTQFHHAVRGAGYVQVLRTKGSRPLLQIMATGQTFEMSFALYRDLVSAGNIIEVRQSKTAVACDVVCA